MLKKTRQPKRRKLRVVVPPTNLTPEELAQALFQPPSSASGRQAPRP